MSEIRIRTSDQRSKYTPEWKWRKGALARRVVPAQEYTCRFCETVIPVGAEMYVLNAFLSYKTCIPCGDARRCDSEPAS